MKRREFLWRAGWGAPAVFVSACAEGEGSFAGPPPRAVTSGSGEPDAFVSLDPGLGVPLLQTLSADWRFLRDQEGDFFEPSLDDSSWDAVALPHTARVEALVTGAPGSATYQWQGTCWYRRRWVPPPEAVGRRVFLYFEGAMNAAEVWLDGGRLGAHLGGYLPFGFDLSERIQAGREHVIAVRLDNRDNPITGPKPLSQLDFNLYGGLYRDVRLTIKGRLYITDPIVEGKVASGGVFVTYPVATPLEAQVKVQVHVRNDDVAARALRVDLSLLDASGGIVAAQRSEPATLVATSDVTVTQTLTVSSPALWAPRTPNLYTLRTELWDGERVVDVEVTRIGIRRVELAAEGLRINGEASYLRGTNRHQEYPYIGYALSAAAQYRDARKIKDAGFDFVRLSHYPHDPSFLDACDELGLVVMNCIPGWQYFNADPAFAALQYENVERMVRRDRNHPSVMLWEAALNETEMPADFIARTHAIVHEEYPGDQCLSAGWREGYDVFIQARQHGGCRGVVARSCLVSEYGDWEYYAANAGLDQTGWQDLAPDERNSRQLRWHGERRLLQQASNFQEALGGNRQTTALGDGLWVMFDYNRGYAPDLESSGCMDIFRLPKLSYYLFQSQRDPSERSDAFASGPMVFIASFWTAASSTSVRVFSNCEAVELYLNGALLERRLPDPDRLSLAVAHPPFTFVLGGFTPGLLEAVAFIGAGEAARHSVRTPSAVRVLALWLDEAGRPFAAVGKDAVMVHAEARDESGTLVPDAWFNVFFGSTGAASLVGANPFSCDAGIASMLLQSDAAAPQAAVYAIGLLSEAGLVRVMAGSVAAGAEPRDYEVRITTDGSAPDVASPLYVEPIAAARLRAALFVAGERVVDADAGTPLFRVQGSRAPT